MKKLRKRKSYSTFSLNSIDSRRKWKSWVILLFFSFYWTHCWAGAGQGRLKRALKGSEQGKNLAFCPVPLFFSFELTADQLLVRGKWSRQLFFFVWENWTAASPQRNEKVSAKTTFFHWTELQAEPRQTKKKRLWIGVYKWCCSEYTFCCVCCSLE